MQMWIQLWEFVRNLISDTQYLLQVLAAVGIVVLNYAFGPFLADEIVLTIGLSLAVPEALWELIVALAQKLRKK